MDKQVRMILSIPILLLSALMFSSLAQEVAIPDAGLNAAIRDTLRKAVGPLTEQDLLSLTNLTAQNRNIHSLEGLDAARNLISLDLERNHVANFSLPDTWTELKLLDLSLNGLTNCVIPKDLTNLLALIAEGNGLSQIDLPGGLTALTWLDLNNNQLTNLSLPLDMTNLFVLDVGFNLLTSFSLSSELTNLARFDIDGNKLASLTVPTGLTALRELGLSENELSNVSLPSGMTNLFKLDLFFNQLTNLTLPPDLTKLNDLDLDFNRLTSLELPPDLTRLGFLHLRSNQFTEFHLPAHLGALIYLDVSKNPLTNITLPTTLSNLNTLRLSENLLTSLTLPLGMTNLVALNVTENQLTNLVLPSDLNRLEFFNLGANQLTSLTLPAGLSNLTGLFFVNNQLTNITLPPDMTNLIDLGFLANPLSEFVLPEPLAGGTNLIQELTDLTNQGVSVYSYPLEIQLVRPLPLVGAFKFSITGPPGVYSVVSSTNLTAWSDLRSATNLLGSLNFTDATANLSPQKFYRALLQGTPTNTISPTNMVFIAPNTFTIGTPNTELHRQPDEGPQTTVTISHGFWLGKFEVTQGEYLSLMSTNPSQFPGDLNRPVETVSWLDATNYCARLTQQELAAGHILPGSYYRLPTEAEWECAARAGTSTRFSYGDDPDYVDLKNHSWYWFNSGFGTHPVGQKLPNPWGLHDMEGNVLEWTQDWYGPYPGGSVTDPQGPSSNVQGVRVIRGGAWDSGEADCRSGRRQAKGIHPLITDSILGFRVVLVIERQ